MTNFEYALLIGGLIANGTLTAFSWANRGDAKRYRDEAYALNEHSVSCECRIRVMHDRVSDLHDCVRESVPVKPYQPYQPTFASAADLVRYGMTQPIQEQPTIYQE